MKKYEGLFILPAEATPDAQKKRIQVVEAMLSKFKGKIAQKTETGKKNLGYPIKKKAEGFFLVLDFELDPALMADFRKGLELEEGVLKYMLTSKQTPSENASTKKKTLKSKPATEEKAQKVAAKS